MNIQNPASYSVVIPCYNGAATIIEAIKSVFSQSIAPQEMIVINDGSTDDSPELIKNFIARYPSARLISTPNNGLSKARALGCSELGDTNYVAFLDADDSWLPLKMETQIAFLEKHPEFSGVSTDFELFSEDSGEIKYSKHKFGVKSQNSLLWQSTAVWGSASAIVIRRKIIEEENIFDPNLKFAEDLDAWCSVLQFGAIGHISQVLVRIRKSRTSMQAQSISDPSLQICSYSYILKKWAPVISPLGQFFKIFHVSLYLMRRFGVRNWIRENPLRMVGCDLIGGVMKIKKLPPIIQVCVILLVGAIGAIYKDLLSYLESRRYSLTNTRSEEE